MYIYKIYDVYLCAFLFELLFGAIMIYLNKGDFSYNADCINKTAIVNNNIIYLFTLFLFPSGLIYLFCNACAESSSYYQLSMPAGIFFNLSVCSLN